MTRAVALLKKEGDRLPGPREFRLGGVSVKKRTRLSKAGNPRLRKALYPPAMTAVRFNAGESS